MNKLPVPKTRFLYVPLRFCFTLRHEHVNTINLCAKVSGLTTFVFEKKKKIKNAFNAKPD